MTVDSVISELSKIPRDYEVVFRGDAQVPERELVLIVSHKEKFVIVKYQSFVITQWERARDGTLRRR